MSDSSADPSTAIVAGPALERGRPVASVMLGEREAGWILRDERGRSYLLASVPGAVPVPLDPARPLATQVPGGATIDSIAQTNAEDTGDPAPPSGADPTLDVSAGEAARDSRSATPDTVDAEAADAVPDLAAGIDSDDPDEALAVEALEPAECEPPPPEPPGPEAFPGPERDEMFDDATAIDSGRTPRVGVTLEVTAGHHGSGTTSPLTHVANKDAVASAAHVQAGGGTAPAAPDGLAAARTLTLAEGAQSSGTVVAVTADRVVQNGGRGTFYVHPRDAFYDGEPTPGTSVTIENRGGRYAVLEQLERDPHERAVERSARTL